MAATIWGLTDVRRRAYSYPDTPLKHRSDLTVYTEAGAAFFDGRPPYEVGNPRGWKYVYPPIFALMLAPLHCLPMQDQATVWFFLCLLMCWGSYRECVRIVALVRERDGEPAEDDRRRFRWLGVATLATVTLPALNCLQRGQATVAVVYLLLLGLRLILSGQPLQAFLGGLALALSIAIKVVPVMPVAFLLFVLLVRFLRERRQGRPAAAPCGRPMAGAMLGVGSGVVLFLLLLPAALIGWTANVRHLDTWSQLVLSSAAKSTATPGFEEDTHSVRNQCLGNALYRLGNFGAYLFADGPEDPLVDDANPPPRLMDSAVVDKCVLLVRLALLSALLLVGLRLGLRCETTLSQAAGFGVACAALLVVSPVARNHYFVLLAPAVLFVPRWLAGLGHQRAAAVLAVVPAVLIGLQYVLLPYVGRVGLLGLGTTAWLMAALVLMGRTEPIAEGAADEQPIRVESTVEPSSPSAAKAA